LFSEGAKSNTPLLFNSSASKISLKLLAAFLPVVSRLIDAQGFCIAQGVPKVIIVGFGNICDVVRGKRGIMWVSIAAGPNKTQRKNTRFQLTTPCFQKKKTKKDERSKYQTPKRYL
jgi:hypothetical protein